MTLKVGALFAGYGGIELALASVLDCDPEWFAEFDKAPSRILAHHWPNVPNLGDVTKVDWTRVEPVDIIAGGSPCQDLSHAGKRAGMRPGTRSGLWASMCDAIDIIRPRLVVWENVRGALSAESDSAVEPCPLCVGDRPGPTLRALGRVLGDLAELGYDARWYGLRASDVGAAHGRFRVFLFATPANGDIAGLQERRDTRGVRATPPGAPAAIDGGHREWATVPGQLTLLRTPTAQLAVNGGSQHPDKRKGGGHGPTLADEVEHLLPTPRATDGTEGGPNQRGSSGDLMLPTAVGQLLPTPTAQDALGSRNSTAWRSDPTKKVNIGDTLTDFAWKYDGHNDPRMPRNEAMQDWREYEAAIRRQEHAFGRLAPMPTEPGAKGQPRLSPRFVEWLMGLPAGWVTDVPSVSRNDQLKALGNGVVPQQCAAALRAFLHDETEYHTKKDCQNACSLTDGKAH